MEGNIQTPIPSMSAFVLSVTSTAVPLVNIQNDLVIAAIGIKLNGSNYSIWSQIVEMYVASRDNKLGY